MAMSEQASGSEDSAKKSAPALGWGVAALVLGIAAGYQLSRPAAETTPGIRNHTELILEGSDTVETARALAVLFSSAGPEALAEVLEAYESSESQVSDLDLILLAEWWADRDPKAAIQWLRKQSGGKRYTATDTAFRVWAREDPQSALKEAKDLEDERERKSAVYYALIGWDESLDTGLGKYVFDLAPSVERQDAMNVLARRRLAQMGEEGALKWGEELPEAKQFRSLMLARLSSVIAESNPEFTARRLEDRITGTSRTGLPRRIATRWVRRDPFAAMAWLESLPAGPDRDDGVMEATRDWLRADPDESSGWIEQRLLAPIVIHPRWLEPGLYLYSRSLIEEKPRRSVEIADMISDEELRLTLYTHIMRTWLRSDPEAAEVWIRSADLPPRVLERGRLLGRRHERAAARAGTAGASAADRASTADPKGSD